MFKIMKRIFVWTMICFLIAVFSNKDVLITIFSIILIPVCIVTLVFAIRQIKIDKKNKNSNIKVENTPVEKSENEEKKLKSETIQTETGYIDRTEILPGLTLNMEFQGPKRRNQTDSPKQKSTNKSNSEMIRLQYKTHLKKAIKTNHFVVVDVETTGLTPGDNELIEIGAVRIKDGRMTEEFSSFIKPTKNIPSRITSLTGIANNMVKDAKSVKEVLKEFEEWLHPDDILMAHNASFDKKFIDFFVKQSGLTPIKNNWGDTLAMARAKVDTPNHKLDTLIQYFHIPINTEERHRALGDAKCEAELLHHLCKLVDETVILLKHIK